MARLTAVHASDSGSEQEEAKSTRKQNATASSNTKNADSGEEGDEGDEDEDGSEYEIEYILDSKRGTFPDGRLGYLVKWKGYGDDQNSWVDEKDIENARDLVEAYWAKKNNKGGRKSIGGKPGPKPRTSTALTSTKGRRASTAKEDSPEIQETKSASTKKRGRASDVQISNGASETAEVKEQPRQSKKAKSASTSTRKSKAARSVSEEMDVDDPVGEETFTSMKIWDKAATWEHVVEAIDTVERAPDNVLYVYFRLKNNQGRCREPSTRCREKMPLKLLDFYENNLRWRNPDEQED